MIYLPLISLQNQSINNYQTNLKISYSENHNKVLIQETDSNNKHANPQSEDFNKLSKVIGASQIAIGLVLLSFTLNKKKKVSKVFKEQISR